MYIEDRLFSENTEEVLYSVTMTEDEYDLFSEFLEEREFGRVQEFKAAKKAFQSKARLEMAKKELAEMGTNPGSIHWENITSNPTKARRISARNTMWNGSYAQDKGLSKRDRLNLRLTKEGESAMSSWAGAHGTTLGNKYPMGKGYHRPK